MRTVQASAKTREEAIQKALDSLGVEMYEVDNIEIVDEGSKGLFGFGARPVVVQVTIENHPDEHALPSKTNKTKPERNKERPERKERPARGRKEQNERPARKAVEKDKNKPAEKRGEKRPQGKGGDTQEQEPRGRRGRGRRGGGVENREKADKGNKRGENRPERKRGGQRKDSAKEQPKDSVKEQPKAQNAAPEAVETAPPPQPEPEPLPPNAVEEDLTVNITDEQGAQAAALLQDIIEKMGITAQVHFSRADDDSARLNVASEDGAILIGRKGRTLNALQYLINRMISLQEDTAENTERVLVDVEGYIDRRRKTLEDMARSFARRAKDTRRNMRLKPLSPQERRIIHLTLQEDEEVRTFSLGDSLYRSIVISPRNAQRSNGGNRGRNSNQARNNAPPESKKDDTEVDAGHYDD